MSALNSKRVFGSLLVIIPLVIGFLPSLVSASLIINNTYLVATSTSVSDVRVTSTDVYVAYEKGGNIYVQKNRSFPDDLGAGSKPSLALDPTGLPQVSYTSSGAIIYVKKVGDSWGTPTTVAPGDNSDLVVDASGYAHIAYTSIGDEASLTDISYASNTLGSFASAIIAKATTTDGTATTTYSSPNVAVNSAGLYRVAYIKNNQVFLRLFYFYQ